MKENKLQNQIKAIKAKLVQAERMQTTIAEQVKRESYVQKEHRQGRKVKK